ncbi:hypothetical protein [Thermodesulfovibrio yellowstonii]|uniref:hypothetical protein n=1 Tax=Thermodesulfovibrio yellowstonii TaxID=28262 RepID=UPI003C7BF3A3
MEKHFFYASRLLACLVFFIFATTVFANEIRRQFYDYLSSDNLFYNINQVKKEAEKKVTELCSNYSEDYLYGGSRALSSQLVCSNSLAMTFPGSAYNPRAGGYVVFGNVIVYLTPMDFGNKVSVTKIVSQEDFLITAVPNPYFPNAYTVSIKIPEGGSAQFMLAQDGIIDIQNISSVYDLEKSFLKQNQKISKKTLVTEILEYYKLLKQKQKISSIDFILSMLTSVEAQENFIEYVLQKQKGGKK